MMSDDEFEKFVAMIREGLARAGEKCGSMVKDSHVPILVGPDVDLVRLAGRFSPAEWHRIDVHQAPVHKSAFAPVEWRNLIEAPPGGGVR